MFVTTAAVATEFPMVTLVIYAARLGTGRDASRCNERWLRGGGGRRARTDDDDDETRRYTRANGYIFL